MPEPLIRIANLYKIFGKAQAPICRWSKTDRARHASRRLVADRSPDINLAVEKSEVFVVMGLSGSGKSTLIRHLNRLIEPTTGSIHVGETTSGPRSRRLKRSVDTNLMVFQRFALLPHRTVLENVAFGLDP